MSEPICMGCSKPLTPQMMVAFWDPNTKQLVCRECARTYKVIFRGSPREPYPIPELKEKGPQ